MEKHTKGWKIIEDETRTMFKCRFITTQDCEMDFGTGENGNWQQVKYDSPGVIIAEVKDSVKQKENARLIAAAPDLLEACKGMLDFPKNGLTMDQAITAAQKAVAKAEGR